MLRQYSEFALCGKLQPWTAVGSPDKVSEEKFVLHIRFERHETEFFRHCLGCAFYPTRRLDCLPSGRWSRIAKFELPRVTWWSLAARSMLTLWRTSHPGIYIRLSNIERIPASAHLHSQVKSANVSQPDDGDLCSVPHRTLLRLQVLQPLLLPGTPTIVE